LFISYSHEDRDFVKRLATDLVNAGVLVWYDEWELSLGDSLRRKIGEGISGSAFLAAVLSKSSIRSKWFMDEVYAAMAVEEEEGRVIVLPILIEDCSIPPLLKDKVHLDFREDYGGALQRLVQRVRLAGADQVGRVREAQFFHDYSFDWGDVAGRLFRLYIVSHSPKLSASCLCIITAEMNEALALRFREYDKAGLSFARRAMTVLLMSEVVGHDMRVGLEDEMPSTQYRYFREQKHGYGCKFEIHVRRLGEASPMAIVYDVGVVVNQISLLMASDERAKVSEEEKKKWADFVLSSLNRP
jgi:hypothetical protein